MITALCIGALIGIVLGLTGAGGSVFAVPLLVLILGLEPSIAMGLALGAVSISAAYGAYLQRSHIVWTPSLIFLTGGIVIAPLGKWLASYISGTYLLFGFCILTIFISSKMYFDAIKNPENSYHTRAKVNNDNESNKYICNFSDARFQIHKKCLLFLITAGSATGFMSGLFGVGGGFLVVPLLLYLGQLTIKHAVASSLLIIFFISGSGFFGFIVFNGLHYSELFFSVLVGAVLGMFLSKQIANIISGPLLQKIFAVSLFVLTLVSVATYTHA